MIEKIQKFIAAQGNYKVAQEELKNAELELVAALGVPEELDGTSNHDTDEFKIRVKGARNVRIDQKQLIAIARENGLEKELNRLFSWAPKIVKTAWDSAPGEVRQVLSAAMSASFGKKTVSVEAKEAKNG